MLWCARCKICQDSIGPLPNIEAFDCWKVPNSWFERDFSFSQKAILTFTLYDPFWCVYPCAFIVYSRSSFSVTFFIPSGYHKPHSMLNLATKLYHNCRTIKPTRVNYRIYEHIDTSFLTSVTTHTNEHHPLRDKSHVWTNALYTCIPIHV